MGSVVLENLDYVALNNLINNLAEFLKNAKINSTFNIGNVLVVLITPLLTGVLTFLVNRNTKNIDYKNDYYKKIIDKRIDAYEKLEQFLGELDVESEHKLDNEKDLCYDFLTDLKKCQKVAEDSVAICSLNSWFSFNLEVKVNDLNEKLANITNKKQERKMEKREAIISAHKEIEKMIREMRLDIINDRLKLHKVEDYLKEKQKHLKN